MKDPKPNLSRAAILSNVQYYKAKYSQAFLDMVVADAQVKHWELQLQEDGFDVKEALDKLTIRK
jgi:hypothetical protein